jgi:thiamine pyrophosphate-dependent acetolactate synthase large subunit-like protein
VAVTTADEIAAAVRGARAAAGPHFILAKVTQAETPAPRIPHGPEAIRDRFRRAMSGH